MSKSEFRRLMIQDPERVYEELERLRRIEAKARAYIEIAIEFPNSLDAARARVALRSAIGGRVMSCEKPKFTRRSALKRTAKPRPPELLRGNI